MKKDIISFLIAISALIGTAIGMSIIEAFLLYSFGNIVPIMLVMVLGILVVRYSHEKWLNRYMKAMIIIGILLASVGGFYAAFDILSPWFAQILCG